MERFFSELIEVWFEELVELVDWPHGTLSEVFEFIDFYPFVLSTLWCCFALINHFSRRTAQIGDKTLPGYSVIVPYYAEAAGAWRSARSLADVHPSPEAIVLVDDGSPDPSEPPWDTLPPQTTLVRLPQNRGKAGALNAALQKVRTPVVIGMDADTVALSGDFRGMLAWFRDDDGLGGVTGNIRPDAPSSLIQWFQALDYLAVICLIKTAESGWQALTTVSGAWVAYRREALDDCQGWDEERATEDIDLSWRMQQRGWRLDYAPRWVASVEMAPTWKAVWRQRRRWSSGLGRTIRDHFGSAFNDRSTHTPIAFLNIFTQAWIGLFVMLGLRRIGVSLWAGSIGGGGASFLISDTTAAYWLTCLLVFGTQLLAAMVIDGGSWRRLPPLLLLAPFYPLYFWCILFPAFIGGFPKGFFRRDSGRWQRTTRLVETGRQR